MADFDSGARAHAVANAAMVVPVATNRIARDATAMNAVMLVFSREREDLVHQ
jgi:hypothetical protein